MELHFTKMEGIGNDYIYVDGINQEVPMDAEFISRISNRHFGIGGDGMIVILKSDQYDFKMRMFNLDGSEGMMCGNGIRCFAKFCYDHHLTDKKVLNIETKAGLRIVELIFDGDEVVGAKVDMQEPILNCKDIPVIFDQEKMIHDILKQRIISLKQAITMSGHSLSMKRVLAMVSSLGVIDEYSSGIAYYKWLKELDDHFDFVALKQKLESVYQNVCFYNRLTLSYPKVRKDVEQGLAQLVKDNFPDAECLMGTATAGIAHAALAADILDLPMGYVRGGAKSHGRNNRIEGVVKEGMKVVVVEDLISTGGSSLECVEALREAGCEVLGLIAIFTYGLDKATVNFENAHCPFVTLSNYDTLIEVAKEHDYIKHEDMEKLKAWKVDPSDESWMNK